MVNCSAVNALCVKNIMTVLNLSFETLCNGMSVGLVFLVDFFIIFIMIRCLTVVIGTLLMM